MTSNHCLASSKVTRAVRSEVICLKKAVEWTLSSPGASSVLSKRIAASGDENVKWKQILEKNFKKNRCHYENWTFFSVSFEYYLVKAQSLGVTTPFCVDSPMGLGMTRHDRSKSRGKLTGNLTEGLDGVLGSQLSVKFSSISLSYQ